MPREYALVTLLLSLRPTGPIWRSTWSMHSEKRRSDDVLMVHRRLLLESLGHLLKLQRMVSLVTFHSWLGSTYIRSPRYSSQLFYPADSLYCRRRRGPRVSAVWTGFHQSKAPHRTSLDFPNPGSEIHSIQGDHRPNSTNSSLSSSSNRADKTRYAPSGIERSPRSDWAIAFN
jgi:hypothetical protein